MRTFENRFVALELPDDWVDRSFSVWVEPAPPPGTFPATLSLARAPAGRADTLQNQMISVLRELKELPEFTLHDRNEFSLGDDTPAVQLLVEWKHLSGEISELVTIFSRAGTAWKLTISAPSARLDELDPILQQVLTSIEVAPLAQGAE